MHVIILTIPRAQNYIEQTIESCLNNSESSITIDFSVGVPTCAYLQDHKDKGEVHYMDKQIYENLRGLSVHRYFNVNYLNALKLVGPEGAILIEDDVIFRDNWDACLKQSIAEVGCQLDTWVLACYGASSNACSSQHNANLFRGKYYCSYVANQFFGTQAMYYTMGEASKLIERFLRYGYGNGKLPQSAIESPPGDLLIKEVFEENQNLYSSIFSIVQHVGYTTTGLGGFHQSETFEFIWP